MASESTNEIFEFAALITNLSPRVIGGLNVPDGIAFDSAGNLWVTNLGNGAIDEINTVTGTIVRQIVGFQNLPSLPGMNALAFDYLGNL